MMRRMVMALSAVLLTAMMLLPTAEAANGINRPETGGQVNPAAHGNGGMMPEAFAKAAQLDDGQRVFLSQAIGALK